jgi:hypothetical protein
VKEAIEVVKDRLDRKEIEEKGVRPDRVVMQAVEGYKGRLDQLGRQDKKETEAKRVQRETKAIEAIWDLEGLKVMKGDEVRWDVKEKKVAKDLLDLLVEERKELLDQPVQVVEQF